MAVCGAELSWGEQHPYILLGIFAATAACLDYSSLWLLGSARSPSVCQDAFLEREVRHALVIGSDESLAGQHELDLLVDVEETGERPVQRRVVEAESVEGAGGGVGFEFEVDDDGNVCWVFVGQLV